jgi:excisionase family DNA binding protein
VTKVETLRALVESAEPGELPTLAGELGRALVAVLVRSAVPTAPVPPASQRKGADTLLTVDEAAERLGVARSWLYRHAKALPFTRKLGHRTLRFDARALELWASTRPAT